MTPVNVKPHTNKISALGTCDTLIGIMKKNSNFVNLITCTQFYKL